MAPVPARLTPTPDERGLATADIPALAATALAAWDAFLEVAREADLDAPARAKGWTGRQVVVHVGAWDENRRLDDILSDARSGRTGSVDQDEVESLVLAAHADAPAEDAVAAVARGRDELARWFAGDGPPQEGLLLTASPLGTLPVLTLLHATCYQLSVAALDLEPCGATVPDALLDRGVGALVDATGALAARAGTTASITAQTPDTFVGTAAVGAAWSWRRLDGDPTGLGPGVEATARVICDITSGRARNVPGLYRSGDLRVHDLTGLMRLAPVILDAPGIPGAKALGRAAGYMGTVGSILARLPFRRA